MAEPAAVFFGFMGGAVGLSLCCLGAAYGTAKAGSGLAAVGVMKPQIVMKCLVPVIMASIVGIYGLIIAIVILNYSKYPSFPSFIACQSTVFGLSAQ